MFMTALTHDKNCCLTLYGDGQDDTSVVVQQPYKSVPNFYKVYMCKDCLEDILEAELGKRMNAHVRFEHNKNIICFSKLFKK